MMTENTRLWRRLFNRQRLREIVIYSLIFFVAGFLGNLWMTRDQAVGRAPVIAADTLAGKKIRFLATPVAVEKKKPALTLLYFFAEWCPICKLQNASISALAKDYRVIGIAMQSGDDAAVKAYLTQHDITFPVVNDSSGRISRAYGVNGVPATFIINRQGNIRYSTRGYATTAGLLARLWLTRMTSDS